MADSFFNNLKDLNRNKAQAKAESWLSTKELCLMLNTSRQNLDNYRRNYEKEYSSSDFKTLIKGDDGKKRLMFSPQFVDYAKNKRVNVSSKKPFVIDRKVKEDAAGNDDSHFDIDNMPPLKAENGVVRYYFSSDEYEAMLFNLSHYPIIKKELDAAKADLKAAQLKIDVLTDSMLKSLKQTQEMISQSNHIEYEKLKGSDK